jgi:hypothetical protein
MEEIAVPLDTPGKDSGYSGFSNVFYLQAVTYLDLVSMSSGPHS